MFPFKKQKTITNASSSKNLNKGFAALFITILVLVIFFGIVVSIINLILGEQKISRNIVASSQAYYAAEAGIEDALLRLKNADMDWTPSYSFLVENTTVGIVISDLISWTRTITATGNAADRFRKVQVTYELSGLTPGLYYGAQIGDGGLVMQGLSTLNGNVFSNGDVNLSQPNSIITKSVVVAGTTKKLFGKGNVGQDASVDICEGFDITQQLNVGGTLEANSFTNCSFDSLVNPALIVDPKSLPIAGSQITEWQEEAAAGDIIIGDYILSGGSVELGPAKIEGNFTIDGGAKLEVTGTIWVTEKITIKNPSTEVYLASSYGSTSGVIIGGTIDLLGGSKSYGSGAAGSYLMYIATFDANPAINIQQGSAADVLYSNYGWISITNTSAMSAIYAKGIEMNNNSGLDYAFGLADAFFTSGPSAGWALVGWQEIE